MSPKSVSLKVRETAKSLSPGDAKDFASTKHEGLPESKEAGSAKQRGFYAMVRKAQSGEKPLSHFGKSVTEAAKKMEPKDATASQVSFTPAPQRFRPPEVSSKLSCVQLLGMSHLFQKRADINSIVMKSHKAVQQASAARRKMMADELAKLRKHNQKLQTEAEKHKATAEDAKLKVREADLKVLQAGQTAEQLKAMQTAGQPQMPPEQPAFGSMLLNAGQSEEETE